MTRPDATVALVPGAPRDHLDDTLRTVACSTSTATDSAPPLPLLRSFP